MNFDYLMTETMAYKNTQLYLKKTSRYIFHNDTDFNKSYTFLTSKDKLNLVSKIELNREKVESIIMQNEGIYYFSNKTLNSALEGVVDMSFVPLSLGKPADINDPTLKQDMREYKVTLALSNSTHSWKDLQNYLDEPFS